MKLSFSVQKYLHRPGIEPGSPAWQASILPLDHRCLYLSIVKCYFLIHIALFSRIIINNGAVGHGLDPGSVGHRLDPCAVGHGRKIKTAITNLSKTYLMLIHIYLIHIKKRYGNLWLNSIPCGGLFPFFKKLVPGRIKVRVSADFQNIRRHPTK